MSEQAFSYAFNEIANLYPEVAAYLSDIPVNFWVTHFINEELLRKNPDGGGGTYGLNI